MTHTVMIIPTNIGVGLNVVAMGLIRAIENQGIRVAFFKPIAQRKEDLASPERTTLMIGKNSIASAPKPIHINRVEQLLTAQREEDLLEDIIANFGDIEQAADLVVVEGMIATQAHPYAANLNRQIAKALDAKVIFVAAPGNRTPAMLSDHIEIAASAYGGIQHPRLLGAIINKMNGPVDNKGNTQLDLADENDDNTSINIKELKKHCRVFKKETFKLLGCVPWDTQLVAPRVSDIAEFLQANILYPGEITQRRVTHITLCARSVTNMLGALRPGTLLITSGDRADIILATCMAALTGIKITALLLTGDYPLDKNILKLCEQAITTGLPILSIKEDSFRTATLLQNINMEIPLDDVERIELVKNYIANHIETNWLKDFISSNYERCLSPPAFRYQLSKKARQANRTIVLPEGNEPRTIQAAAICAQRNIANCILLGDTEEITRIAEQHGIELNANIQIINPANITDKYIKPMVKLREHKGLTELIAKEQLKDNVVLATMMLQQGEVDGLVSGALHTTANTIRPALQLIKTAEKAKIVSSIFFMCMPDQVLVYGDCAVNPDPNAEELADIAIQSADSAAAFGITPRVAMISYSTGTSGTGVDVEKVRAATEIVQQKRVDIIIDGPLQYDAALIDTVAQKKAPNSPVAGKATVVIFPDLNTGNTTYKAVQRSANVLSIGPMLQGLNKPVNDLSRGATIEDIVFTIAITAIQA